MKIPVRVIGHTIVCVKTIWKDLGRAYKIVSALADASNQRTLSQRNCIVTQLCYPKATTTRFTPAKGIIRWLGHNGIGCTISEKSQMSEKL